MKACYPVLSSVPTKIIDLLLLAQPFLSLTVLLSVLIGAPPVWLSWLIALVPIPVRYFHTRRVFYRTPFDIPIIILTAGMLLGFFLSPSHELALSALNTYFACILFYYGITSNAKANRSYWIVFFWFIFTVFLLLSIFVFIGGEGKYVSFNIWLYDLASKAEFFQGISLHSNVLGCISAVSIPILVAVSLFPQRRWLRFSAATFALLFTAILVLSASGGGWIATLLAVIVVLSVRGKKTLLIVTAAIIIFMGATVHFWYKADWLAEVLPFQNLLARMDFWRATVSALSDHPFTGLGLGGWWSSVEIFRAAGGPHSSYLQLYSDCGLIGLIALITAIFAGIKLAIKTLLADKANPYFGLALGFLAGCIAASACAVIENIFVSFVPVGERILCFSVPLVWLLLAGLVLSCQRLFGEED